MNRFKYFTLKNKIYNVDKYLVLCCFLIICGLFVYTLSYDWNGSNQYYSVCPMSESKGCFNTLYNHELCVNGKIPSLDPLCTTKYMYAGQSIGTPPPFLIVNFPTIGFLILLIFVSLNHFKHNRGFFNEPA